MVVRRLPAMGLVFGFKVCGFKGTVTATVCKNSVVSLEHRDIFCKEDFLPVGSGAQAPKVDCEELKLNQHG